MKYVLLVSIALIGYSLGTPVLKDVETEWIKFKEQHAKQYNSLLEENERKTIFALNYEKVMRHNELYEQGLETYFLNINQRADMTTNEINKLNGYKKSRFSVSPIESVVFKAKEGVVVPASFDWRDKGAVTEVKDQGSCGSCWAFSSLGSVEGQYFLKTGQLVNLSVQNLMDCSHGENAACRGGDMIPAFKFIHENDGIDSEASYPYIAFPGNFCNYSTENNVTSLKGYGIIREGSEEDLKAAVSQVGPISVAIDPSYIDLYSGGIYYYKDCNVDDKFLSHAVLVVGYGSENDQDYWLVKNSWGLEWGINGYIKMSRNRNNNCGIATSATYPIMY